MVTSLLARSCRITVLAAAFAHGLPSARAESFTLTDKQGRSIEADVISVENDVARIKRSDGMRFELPLANLVEADQKALRDWAKHEAEKPLPPNAVEVAASRGMFGSTKNETQVPNPDESSTRTMLTQITTHERWGYNLEITNKSGRLLENLQVEYRIFGPKDHRAIWAGGKHPVGSLKPHEKTAFKTRTITLTKEAYKGDSARPAGNGLRGVWVRIYRGRDLIHESSTPDNLRLTEYWLSSAEISDRPSFRPPGSPP